MKQMFRSIISEAVRREFGEVVHREVNIPLNSTSNKIIAIVGPRRSGKTFKLYSIVNELRTLHSRENVIYVNFEDERLVDLGAKDLQFFLDAYYELYTGKEKEEKCFVFDEIQEIKGWEKFVRRIYDQEKCRIFLSGSSSKMLSREIATSLRGRTIEFEILTLNFREFLDFKKIGKQDVDTKSSKGAIIKGLEEYIQFGGYPEVVLEDNKLVVKKTLENYFDLIVYKDLVDRYQISNTSLLRYLIKNIFINTSKPFSVHKMYNDLKSQGYKVAKNTLYQYLDNMIEGFVLFDVSKYSKSIRERSNTVKKLYVSDLGIRSLFMFNPFEDIGRLYENLAYLHLRELSSDIFYYHGKQEVDFFVERERLLLNVCYNMSDFDTRTRELKGIAEGMANFGYNQSMILTADEEGEEIIDGKKVYLKPLWKWMLKR